MDSNLSLGACACANCWGNGTGLDGKPCPNGCQSRIRASQAKSAAELETRVRLLETELSSATMLFRLEARRADRAEAQAKRLTDAILQFRNEPILGRNRGVRQTDGYGAMEAALEPTVPTREELTEAIGVRKAQRAEDRARFPDPDFNRWLDEPISDTGHTVWDKIENVCDAWHGWDTRDSYRREGAQPISAKAEYDQLCADGVDPDPLERLRIFLSLCLKGQNWIAVEPFIKDLAAGPQRSIAWIRTADRLPDDGQYVIVFDIEAATLATWPARYDAKKKSFSAGGGWFEVDEVTHWLLLPLPTEYPDVEPGPKPADDFPKKIERRCPRCHRHAYHWLTHRNAESAIKNTLLHTATCANCGHSWPCRVMEKDK